MDKALIAQLLDEFDRNKPIYETFTEKVSSLITEILAENSFKIHSVTCRTKQRSSLSKKLAKPDRDYAALSDITDLVGIRIITHLADEVDKVAEIIIREFEVDLDKSVDKRATLDPDRFGYLSLHYIA